MEEDENELDRKLSDYRRAEACVTEQGYDDIHFFLLLFEYQRLSPEERLARGLQRGRRKYFLIRK